MTDEDAPEDDAIELEVERKLERLEEIAGILREADVLGDERLRIYAELRQFGVTYKRIGDSAGVTEEAVVQAVHRYKRALSRQAAEQARSRRRRVAS